MTGETAEAVRSPDLPESRECLRLTPEQVDRIRVEIEAMRRAINGADGALDTVNGLLGFYSATVVGVRNDLAGIRTGALAIETLIAFGLLQGQAANAEARS